MFPRKPAAPNWQELFLLAKPFQNGTLLNGTVAAKHTLGIHLPYGMDKVGRHRKLWAWRKHVTLKFTTAAMGWLADRSGLSCSCAVSRACTGEERWSLETNEIYF